MHSNNYNYSLGKGRTYDDDLAVFKVVDLLKLLDREPVVPHQEQPHKQAVRDNDDILAPPFVVDAPEDALEKASDSVKHVCAVRSRK